LQLVYQFRLAFPFLSPAVRLSSLHALLYNRWNLLKLFSRLNSLLNAQPDVMGHNADLFIAEKIRMSDQ